MGDDSDDWAPVFTLVLFGQIVRERMTWDEVEKACKFYLRRNYQRHNVKILKIIHEQIPDFIKKGK